MVTDPDGPTLMMLPRPDMHIRFLANSFRQVVNNIEYKASGVRASRPE